MIRVQITVTKLANVSTELHKLSVLGYRLIKLIRKGIGIPWRETKEEEAAQTGQELEILTEFNTTGFISKGLDPKQNVGNEEKVAPIDLDEDDVDKLQDEINQPGSFKVKGFTLKSRTTPLWLLFAKKK